MKDIIYSKIKSGLYAACEDGTIFSKTTKKIMKTSLDKDGYICLSLRSNGTSYSKFGVHRLIMIAFKPVENMENLQVNHIDGNKQNNSLDNLEWVTVQQNLKHARDTGLNKIANNTSIDESEAKEIINMLMLGYTTSEIIEKFPTMTKGSVSKIRTGATWSKLSNGLVFPAPLNTKSYSREQIEKACILIKEGKNNNEIMDLIFGTREQKYRIFVNDIRTKKSHTVLSNKYF